MRALPPALVAAFLGLLACSFPAHAQLDPRAEAIAQERFTRGRTLFEEGDSEHAAEEFRQAAALSDSPNVRLYLARAYRELHRYAEAVVAYESAVRLAEANPRRYRETAEAAQLEREALEETLARITLVVTPMPRGLVFTLDGESLPIEALGIPYPVAPGGHIARFEAPGHTPVSLRLELGPGSEDEQVVTLEPLSGAASNEGEPSGRAGTGEAGVGWAAPLVMGLGAAAMLGAAPPLVLAGERFSQLREGCPMGVCQEALRGTLDEGRTMESLGLGLLASGAAVLVVGGVLFVLDLANVIDL